MTLGHALSPINGTASKPGVGSQRRWLSPCLVRGCDVQTSTRLHNHHTAPANGWACPAFGPTTSETTTNSTIWIVFQPEIVYGLCLPPVEHHTFSFANYYNFGLIDHSWWTWFYINVFVQLVRVPRGDAQLCTPKICEKQKAWGWCAEFWSHINMISCVSPCES